MFPQDIIKNLNKTVYYDGTPYKLTAGIIRKDKNGLVNYTAELQDINAPWSIMTTYLRNINIKGG